jgi:hypothetical protein
MGWDCRAPLDEGQRNLYPIQQEGLAMNGGIES